MQLTQNQSVFWHALAQLVYSNQVKIDRPAGSSHPRYPDMIYPLDYGYLDATHTNDKDNLDVWLGSRPDRQLTGALLTVDLEKSEAEIKLLLGCTVEEVAIIENFTRTHGMAAWTILRKDME